MQPTACAVRRRATGVDASVPFGLFNERLVHHDGVLAQAVSRAQGITFDQAVKTIEQEVAQLKTDITGGSTVAIERVGRLYKGRNERVQFWQMKRWNACCGPLDCATSRCDPSPRLQPNRPFINPRKEGDSDAFATCFGAIGAHCRGVGRAGARWTWECSLPIAGTCKTLA